MVSQEIWDTVAPASAGNLDLRTVIVIGADAPAGTLSYSEFLIRAKPQTAVHACDDKCAFWLYSSASTGLPKGVRHVHSALWATVETYGAKVLGIREEDVIYSAAKIFFAYGWGNALTFPMSAGATTVLLAGWPTPDGVLDIIEAEQPSIFCGVPTLYGAVVASLTDKTLTAHCLRLCISASEALPTDISCRWHGLFGVDILDCVGSH